MNLNKQHYIWMYRLSLAGMILVLLVIVFFALGSSLADSAPDDILPKIIIGLIMLSPINFLLSLVAFLASRKLCIEPESPYNSGRRFATVLLWISGIPTCLLVVWLLIMLQWGYDLGGVR